MPVRRGPYRASAFDAHRGLSHPFAVASHRVNREPIYAAICEANLDGIARPKEIDAERPAMVFIARRPGVGLRLQR
jgi:hypothetical protein